VSTILLLKSGEPMPKIGYTEDTFDLVEVEEPSRIQAAKKVALFYIKIFILEESLELVVFS